jgi:glycosyltransferase involved in cell wall biosynthesis
MNILFSLAHRRWGGEKIWALETASALTRRGHRCVMVGRRGNPWVKACQDAGLPVRGFSFGPRGNPVVAMRVAALAREMAVDVLIVNNDRDLFAGCVAGALVRRPVVRRVGGPTDFDDDTALERLLSRYLLAGLMTVGHRSKEEMLRRYPWLRPESIEVIHIGKDIAQFRPERGDALKRAWGLPADTVLFGVTSQLEPRKGHRRLLEALASVVRARPWVRLAIVGTGDERPHLERYARELGLENHVRLLGFRRDVPDLLSNFDAFVLPSLAEGEAFPNTLVEAMASGLPCITTDVCSVREIVVEEANGILVTPGDVAELAAALQRLATDPGLRQRLGKEARERVEREFSLEAKVTELERYLERIRLRGEHRR